MVKKLSVDMDAIELGAGLRDQEVETFLVAPGGQLFPLREVLHYGRHSFQ